MNDLSKIDASISFGEQLVSETYGIPFHEVKRIKHLLLADNLISAAKNVLKAVTENGSIVRSDPITRNLEAVLRSVEKVRSQELVLSIPSSYLQEDFPIAQPQPPTSEGSSTPTT